MHTAGKVLLIIGGVITALGIVLIVGGAATANLDPSSIHFIEQILKKNDINCYELLTLMGDRLHRNY